MGVPVVTLAGTIHAARVGVSLLSNVGLAELVARTPEQYVELAVGLAGDLPRLAELRATLRARMQASPLMDEKGFAGDVEAAYGQMWRKWCASAAGRG
jgi:predicted O-linked N-acetylglucosamine transferase (SPINDLY family)